MNAERGRVLKAGVPIGLGQVRAGRIDRLLAVGFQDGRPVVWFEGEPGDSAYVDTCLVMTGEAAPRDSTYIGTAQTWPTIGGPPFVVHLYKRLSA